MVIVAIVAADAFMVPRQCHLTAMLSHDMPGGEEPTEQKHDCNGSMKKPHEPKVSATGVRFVKRGFGRAVRARTLTWRGGYAESHRRIRCRRQPPERSLAHQRQDARAAIAHREVRGSELAAGWNAGAQKLGVKLPAWVARHGSARCSAAVIKTFTRFRIILSNAVKYVTNVESYDRRIQSAFNIQGRKMQRRAEFLPARAIRKAGAG